MSKTILPGLSSGLPRDFMRQTDALKDALKTLDLVNSPALKTMTDLSRQLGAARISQQIEAAPVPQIAAMPEGTRHLEQLVLPGPSALEPSGYAGLPAGENRRSGEREKGPVPTHQAVTSMAVLGQFLKAARLRMGLTQQELADIAGVGRRFVSELEAGKPTLETGKVLLVCASLGIDLFAEAR